jgi:signal transduction histidine kinase
MYNSGKADHHKKSRVPVGILPDHHIHEVAPADDSTLKKITESLYKQNLELSVKNKTLSLLRQLYQISILTLDPEPLGGRVVKTVRDALELEMVSIWVFDELWQRITPLTYSLSNRLGEAIQESIQNFNINSSHLKNSTFFSTILEKKEVYHTGGFGDIFEDSFSQQKIDTIIEKARIITSSGYPLIIDGKLIGVLVLSQNRQYESLPLYEKESITSLIEVIAVALNKSFLYQQLTITNNKLSVANERLKELDQMKSEFVSLATHQIRGPLTAIKGYISLVREGDYGPVSPEVLSAIDVVFQSTNNLVTIVADFLDVSRIEQGRMQYDFKTFDLEKLINQVVAELKPNIEKRGLSLNYAFEGGQDYSVHADQGKIKQIIGNIIDNAIKYTPEGYIDILVKKQSDKILIKISDTGVGIPKLVIPKLFRKFSRAENANDVNILGTGLGLYVVKQMIEAHHGRVWVESEGEGKGSQFYIELPVSSIPQKII